MHYHYPRLNKYNSQKQTGSYQIFITHKYALVYAPQVTSMQAIHYKAVKNFFYTTHILYTCKIQFLGDVCMQKYYYCEKLEIKDDQWFILLRIYLHCILGLSGDDFRFLSNGDGPPRYRILNFHQSGNDSYVWSTVGFFKHGNLTDVSNSFSYRYSKCEFGVC